MAFRAINLRGKPLTIHKAMTEPLFGESTVLVTDTWDYIDLWLKRKKESKARFFWEQARHFFAASNALPKESAPLPAYYCMLNATKALLLVKKVRYDDQHGVSGVVLGTKSSISNEQVTIKSNGILPALCRHLDESANNEQYTLRHLLYNLVYIHRAFTLSVQSGPELFIPIHNPRIVRSMTNSEAWFCCEIQGQYANQHTINKVPPGFEQDEGITDQLIVRKKKRFQWSGNAAAKLSQYEKYHRNLRKHLYYIHGPQRLWYLKRRAVATGSIGRSTLTLTFAAMHKLSELARYSPDVLRKHFDGRYNWLLSEFIAVAPTQFLDAISSEMTGNEFMPPGRANP